MNDFTPLSPSLPPALPPARALAWSEARLDGGFPNGRPALGLWRPEGLTAAVGLAQDPNRELDTGAMRRDGVGLVRRQSGGGTVLLYPGVLCWEAWATADDVARFFPGVAESGIRQAYAFLSRPAAEGLKRLGVPVFSAGICDLSATPDGGGEARKVVGMAQLRRRDKILVHGSILVEPDMELLAKYLKMPADQPEYRRGRRHRDFCLSAAERLRLEAGGDGALTGRLAAAMADLARILGWETLTPPARLDPPAADLENGKYRSDAWNWERKRGV